MNGLVLYLVEKMVEFDFGEVFYDVVVMGYVFVVDVFL